MLSGDVITTSTNHVREFRLAKTGPILNSWTDSFRIQGTCDPCAPRIITHMAEMPSIGLNLRVTTDSKQGGRKYMEDVLSVKFEKGSESKGIEFAYFAVFDGHGGAEAGLFAKEHLLSEITKLKGFWSEDDDQVLKAIKDGFINTHKLMWKSLSKYETPAWRWHHGYQQSGIFAPVVTYTWTVNWGTRCPGIYPVVFFSRTIILQLQMTKHRTESLSGVYYDYVRLEKVVFGHREFNATRPKAKAKCQSGDWRTLVGGGSGQSSWWRPRPRPAIDIIIVDIVMIVYM